LFAYCSVLMALRVGDQLRDDVRQRRGTIGDDLVRFAVRGERSREEPPGRSDVAAPRDEHVDDLAVLVVGAEDVAPDAGDLHVGLIGEPSEPDCVAARSRRVDQQRREALHPPEHGDVIDVDPALGEEFFEVTV
jgi:hypothetical protein